MAGSEDVIWTSIGPALVVPTEYFLQHVLPPLHPDIDLDKVLARLRRHGEETSQDHYQSRSGGGGSPEDPAKLKTLRGWGIAPSQLHMLQNPRPEPDPDRRHGDTLPDAYMVKPSEANAHWGNISVIGEHEKCDSNNRENVAKLVWSISQAFDDPRRRFVFGYSIENMAMRLWFCDRTQLVASPIFNFITDHRVMSHFFLSLSYAEPHHLGWDLSVRVAEGLDRSLCYEFTVESEDGSISTFRSLEQIARSRSKHVIGKNTRVWKAVRIVNDVPADDIVVLKDAWVNVELGREGAALDQIQQYDNSEEFQERFSTNFLTVLCHGEVVMHSKRERPHCDRTRDHTRNAEAFKTGKPLPDPDYLVSRPLPVQRLRLRDPILSGCKVHYRIVFKEYCTSLRLSTPCSRVFTALAQATEALKLLHEAGWIHRDVSLNNIMLDATGHARLVDLEYAKRMDDESIPDMKLGTEPFISAEVAKQAYYCIMPPSPPSRVSSDADLSPRSRFIRFAEKANLPISPLPSGSDSSFDEEHMIAFAARKRQKQLLMRENELPAQRPKPPSPSRDVETPTAKRSISPLVVRVARNFRYNPLHDLESLFWIAAYFLFKTTGADMGVDEIERQQEAASALLYDHYQHSDAIRLDGVFEQALYSLDSDVQKVGLVLEEWRAQLATAFYAAEKDRSSITSSVGAELYETLAKTLREMAKLSDGVLHTAFVRNAPAGNKRPLEEVDGEESTDVSDRPAKKARQGIPMIL
ncbi:hypothetical protein NM688_g7838 [Phlebia brevispora]|uniref:Uncharacterized protein n=1 Tax=Phlebia brevispora TaxID=194682 RepID=A0ACC1S0M2_9APHY|nr:hypothetical protein NM688_g7838 [Phlebia brevispora]